MTEKLKKLIIKPGTVSVARYKMITTFIHLKTPKVIRLIGKSSIFIIGLIIIEPTIKAMLEKISVYIPFTNIIPLMYFETMNKVTT